MEDWYRSEMKSGKLYGKVRPASGAGVKKMDIEGLGTFSGWFGENKYTEKDSYSLKAETIKKAILQASGEGGKPFFILDFGTHNLRMVMVEEKEWINLMGNQQSEEEDSPMNTSLEYTGENYSD